MVKQPGPRRTIDRRPGRDLTLSTGREKARCRSGWSELSGLAMEYRVRYCGGHYLLAQRNTVKKLMLWTLLALVLALIFSEINIKTSLYKAADNSVEIIFPEWQTDDAWFYLYWTPGQLEWRLYRQQAPTERRSLPAPAKF